MTNTGMFFRMLFSAVFRRRSRAVMAVVASLVGAATLFCLAMICLAVPQQMNEEMRAYGANLIVTPTESTNADGKAGIDKAMVQHTTEMVKAKGSAKYATYRYENVRVNASPYVMAGVNAAQVKNLNHHWVVDGSWPTDGKVLVGRDIADAIGLRIGSAITIGYRASDNASTNGTSSNSSIDQQTNDGRVSSDIMDTSGTEFRVAGIVDTGGSEDSIIYATNADVNKLTGITRGVDVIEYSAGASDLAGLVSSINDMTSMHVKAQQVTKITASDTRIITMLQTLFWIVSLVVLVLTEWIARGTRDADTFAQYIEPHWEAYALAWALLFLVWLTVDWLTRFAPLATLVTAILGCVPAAVDFYTLQLRGEPFLPCDLAQVSEAAGVASAAGIHVQTSMIFSAVLVLALTVGSFFLYRGRQKLQRILTERGIHL